MKSHRAIPQDRQPGKASITLKPDQIAVRLTYQEPPYPRKAPVESLKNPYGVDSGVVCTVATSTGIAYTSPNEARLNARIRRPSGNWPARLAPQSGWAWPATRPGWTPTTVR